MAVRNKEVNLTAVLWPSQVGTVTYIWWIENNTEVLFHSRLSYFSLGIYFSYACAQLSRLLTVLLQNMRIINFFKLFLCIQVEKSVSFLISFQKLQSKLILDTQSGLIAKSQ